MLKQLAVPGNTWPTAGEGNALQETTCPRTRQPSSMPSSGPRVLPAGCSPPTLLSSETPAGAGLQPSRRPPPQALSASGSQLRFRIHGRLGLGSFLPRTDSDRVGAWHCQCAWSKVDVTHPWGSCKAKLPFQKVLCSYRGPPTTPASAL